MCGLRTKGRTICNYVSFHSICAGNLSFPSLPSLPSRGSVYISTVFAVYSLYIVFHLHFSGRPFPLASLLQDTRVASVADTRRPLSVLLPRTTYDINPRNSDSRAIPRKHGDLCNERIFIKNPIRALFNKSNAHLPSKVKCSRQLFRNYCRAIILLFSPRVSWRAFGAARYIHIYIARDVYSNPSRIMAFSCRSSARDFYVPST